LVCHAFNADFDGDQMAVHVPLSETAQAEARILMLSTQNLFSPAHGGPIVAPIQDIVLGLYYVTEQRDDAPGAGCTFASPEEAIHAYETEHLGLLAPIKCRVDYVNDDDSREFRVIDCTVGRLFLNQILPPRLRYRPMFTSKPLLRDHIAAMVSLCHRSYGATRTIQLLDAAKARGFRFATK